MKLSKTSYYVLILGLLALGTMGAYWPVFHCDFVNYDDPEYVTNNLIFRQGFSLTGFRWAFSTLHAGNWHPLTWLSHMLDRQLFAFNPAGHHGTSLLLHVANALLLFTILRRTSGALWRSALVAALFAWHPLHVESVAWIAERKDVLSTFFGLLSIWTYVHYVQSKVQSPKSKVQSPKSKVRGQWSVVRSPWSFFYLLSLVLCACSLMSKPMLVTLPCLLLLLDYWPLRRLQLEPQTSKREIAIRLLREKLPFFALSLASSVVTLVAQRRTVVPLGAYPPADRIGNAVVAVAGYIKHMVWPANLAVYYPYAPRPSWQIFCSSVLVVVLSWLALRSLARRPWFAIGWLWFLVTLTPVIGLVQVGSQAMADRYSYVPLIGLFIAISWGLAGCVGGQDRRRAAVGLGAALLLCTCLAQTRAQVRHWQNSVSLFTHARRITGDNPVVSGCLGFGYLQENKLDEALAHFEIAARLAPDIPQTHDNVARVLLKQGRVKEGMAEAIAALRWDPGYAPALDHLGRGLFLQGQTTQAVQLLTQSVQLSPHDPDAQADLAEALASLGQLDDAIAHYAQALAIRRNAQTENRLAEALALRGNLPLAVLHWQAALQLDPRLADAHFSLSDAFAGDDNADQAITHLQHGLRLLPERTDARLKLATLLVGRRRTGEAIQEYREFLRRSPDTFEPINNLAWLLATHPDAKLRNGFEAVGLAERAVRLAGPGSPSALDTLAAAYAEAGCFGDAVKTIQKAIVLAEGSGQTNMVAKFRTRLGLYQAAKPFHETR